jgi:hypothetical protein
MCAVKRSPATVVYCGPSNRRYVKACLIKTAPVSARIVSYAVAEKFATSVPEVRRSIYIKWYRATWTFN